MTIQKILQKYDFQHAGEIRIRHVGENPIPDFALTDDFYNGESSKKHGLVYLWVLKDGNGTQEICYVGKAGKTLKARCNQHQGGARQSPSGSKKGRANARGMDAFLKRGKCSIQIYVRQSSFGNILDEQVNLCEAEEKAIILKCKNLFDLWNKS